MFLHLSYTIWDLKSCRAKKINFLDKIISRLTKPIMDVIGIFSFLEPKEEKSLLIFETDNLLFLYRKRPIFDKLKNNTLADTVATQLCLISFNFQMLCNYRR